jgi:hypothetical protein
MMRGSNYLRAYNQGFTLVDYANLNSFTIDSSLPKLYNARRRVNLKYNVGIVNRRT